MKASEVIEALKKIVEAKGDLEAVCADGWDIKAVYESMGEIVIT